MSALTRSFAPGLFAYRGALIARRGARWRVIDRDGDTYAQCPTFLSACRTARRATGGAA